MVFKDKAKEKEYQEQYKLDHKKEMSEYQKVYHRRKFDNDPDYVERRRANTKKWDLEHPEEIKLKYINNREEILKHQKVYNEENKEKRLEWRKKHYLKYRKIAIDHYTNGTNKCACCGETTFEFLTFDHINGGGGKHRDENKIRNMSEWLIKNNFPDGFRVLCYNCNCCLGHNGFCSHNKPEIENFDSHDTVSKWKSYHMKRRKEHKILVISHYSSKSKCQCCDENMLEFLTIDHINGNGRKHVKELKRFGSAFYRWLIDNNFPDGFRVLCYNCNCSIGHCGYCPHQKKKKKN